MNKQKVFNKLKRERASNLIGFPLIIRTKPTAHTQYCFACRMPINKGQLQIRMNAGLWRAGNDNTFTALDSKFNIWYHSTPGTKEMERFYPRYVYLHISCFSCLLKKMFSKVGVPLIPNCETCDMRFNCYTNNMSIDDLDHQPPYVSSRPCNNELKFQRGRF